MIAEPPQSHLIGRSAKYVEVFSKSYSDRTCSLQIKYAVRGCFTSTAGLVTLLGLFLLTFDMPDPWNPSGIGR
jgi:hypothetical protein